MYLIWLGCSHVSYLVGMQSCILSGRDAVMYIIWLGCSHVYYLVGMQSCILFGWDAKAHIDNQYLQYIIYNWVF